MPLQNRVDPWGRLHAVDTRGTLLGNRGMLHNARRAIVTTSARKAWITCRLEFEGRKREVFGVGTYSELFFLDEATALSAGHRPCAECRRERYKEFKIAWVKTNSISVHSKDPSISEIDKVIHAERMGRNGEKVTFEAPLIGLPVGTFVEHDDAAFLIWPGGLLRWSFSGYGGLLGKPTPSTVRVLTPRSIVNVYRSGFVPAFHASAEIYSG